ncbi:MAG: ABC transporter substrate-binding protein [Defluviitaleaceae bacterium]|nr:ABC transporter substrate-binding protein [Defluviitaleaceae bacterium]
MKKVILVLLLLSLLIVGALSGCVGEGDNNGGDDAAVVSNPLEAMDSILEEFPQYINTGLPHVEGTTLYYGIAMVSPWMGMIGGAVFHNETADGIIATILGSGRSLLSMNEMRMFGQEGVANFEYCLDTLTFTLNMQHDVYWHDGTPLTLDDLVFAYEVMAHPDYTGPRFGAEAQAVVGIMDFRNGEAEYISGLVLSNNNRTLTMHFEEMGPGMLYGGIWTAPVPRHVFEGIPVAEMAESDYARTSPIGWGPFMFEHTVVGETISMVRNPNYVFGAPIVERLQISRIDPELVAEHMNNGTFDLMTFPTVLYGDHMNPENFRYLGTPVGDYTFIAFRLGIFHPEDPDNPWGPGVNVYAPTRLMAQAGRYFRQAMAYAIDPSFIGETVFNGLQFAATSNVPPNHPGLIDPTVPSFTYNPERARELLDQAGFDQFDDEGFRLCPDGERFTVYWAFPEAPLTEGIIVPFYISSWEEVGVRVELWRGSTHPAFTIWDYTDFDLDYTPGEGDMIHMFNGAWTVGNNPNPAGSWGHIWWNFSRYTSPEYDAILDRMNTLAAFDEDYWLQIFSDWQLYWYENVPAIPLLWTIELTAVNNRVNFWDTRHYTPHSWNRVGLSAPQPYGR